jgi:hypothetical protein
MNSEQGVAEDVKTNNLNFTQVVSRHVSEETEEKQENRNHSGRYSGQDSKLAPSEYRFRMKLRFWLQIILAANIKITPFWDMAVP